MADMNRREFITLLGGAAERPTDLFSLRPAALVENRRASIKINQVFQVHPNPGDRIRLVARFNQFERI